MYKWTFDVVEDTNSDVCVNSDLACCRDEKRGVKNSVSKTFISEERL